MTGQGAGGDATAVAAIGDLVAIARDRAAFLGGVSAALAVDPTRRDRGRAVARSNTWADRARTFLDILDAIVERRSQLSGAA